MVAVGDATTEPETALPVAKFVPVHDVALVEDHAMVVELPTLIFCGVAVRVAVGAGVGAVTVTVALAAGDVPPAPVQLSV